MEKDYIQELNELRRDLEISKKDFIRLLVLALYYQKVSKQYISEEDVSRIVEEALINIDYENDNKESIKNEKEITEVFERALNNLGYNETKRTK